jgi:uncharacterized membrane protein (UPF0127 family)
VCGSATVVADGAGEILIPRCYIADRPLARLVGLLGTRDLADDEGLWLEPCSSVHTAGMRIPIACAFLDAGGRVLRVVDPLRPWRHASARGARAVIETRPGRLAGVLLGATLRRQSAAEGSA